jgi:type IV fimbrial biogenesis protein FimT
VVNGSGCPHGRSPSAGFTLIELVVVVAVAAMLLIGGVPSLQAMVRDNRLIAAANDVVARLNLARSEAIKRRGRVALCSTTDSAAEVPTCDGGGVWGTGWVLFLDADGNGAADARANVLRAERGPGGEVVLRASTGRVTFGSDGGLVGGATVSFALCDSRGEARGRQVTVGLTGRPEVSHPAADCTP